jgi:perosamine synthetase
MTEVGDVPFARTVMSIEARAAALRVLESGWVTTGRETERFEAELAAWVGADHAVAVSSCTAAIELSLRALALPRDSKVLVSAMTFCGAVHAIVHAGLQPVLVDVDLGTGMPSASTTGAAAHACGGAAAMVVVHLGGCPAPVDDLAAAAGISTDLVIEDAAHAIGTWVGGRPVGTISRATCFSFYATKNLPIGEGGMVTTADPDLAAWVRRARLHGMSADAWRRYLPGGSWRYTVDDAGLKANPTDLQAAIGRAQLTHLRRWQRRRAEIAARYDGLLLGVPGLELPPRPARGRHAWHLYAVRIRSEFGFSRDRVSEALASRGVGTSVHFIPLHHMPYFRDVAIMPPGGLPGADAVFAETLSLPMHQWLTDDEVDRVVDALADIRASSRLMGTVR